MRRTRMLLAGLGLATVAYGVWLIVRWQSGTQLRQVGEWALAGVVLHDALLAPVALAVGWAIQRLLPRLWWRAAAVTGVLAGALGVASFAVLTRSHAGGRNQTLLDRSYPRGLALWVGAVVLVAVLATAAAWVRGRARSAAEAGASRRPRRRRSDGTGHGR